MLLSDRRWLSARVTVAAQRRHSGGTVAAQRREPGMERARAQVLVVGAGPTGLTLAAALAAHGILARVVDRSLDRVHESRALAVQPRTLEVLAGFGITPRLLAAGNPAVGLRLHAGRREVAMPLFDLGLDDCAY